MSWCVIEQTKFQRKELAAMCKELEKQKELVAQDNEMKTNLRDSLKPRLEALLKVERIFYFHLS